MGKKYLYLLLLIGSIAIVTAQILSFDSRDYEFELWENQTDVLRTHHLLSYNVTNILKGDMMERCLNKEFNGSVILQPCFRYKNSPGVLDSLDDGEMKYMKRLANSLLREENIATPIINSTGTTTIRTRD